MLSGSLGVIVTSRSLSPTVQTEIRLPLQPESFQGGTLQDTILPASCVLAVVTWDMESLVRKAQHTHQIQQDPGNGPTNHLFVSDSVPSHLLTIVDRLGLCNLWLSRNSPQATADLLLSANTYLASMESLQTLCLTMAIISQVLKTFCQAKGIK